MTASAFRGIGRADWQPIVFEAVEEALHHPLGGKVEITVYPELPVGCRRLVIYPSLWGVKKASMQLRMDED